MTTPELIGTIIAATTIGIGLLTAGIQIGLMRSKYLSKEDFEKHTTNCENHRHGSYDELREEMRTLEDKVINMENKLDDKNMKIFSELEQVRLDIVKLQTMVIALDKSLGKNHG